MCGPKVFTLDVQANSEKNQKGSIIKKRLNETILNKSASGRYTGQQPLKQHLIHLTIHLECAADLAPARHSWRQCGDRCSKR